MFKTLILSALLYCTPVHRFNNSTLPEQVERTERTEISLHRQMGSTETHPYSYVQKIDPTGLTISTHVWASQNNTKLTKFQHTITRNIMETRYNANSAAAEVLLGIPPIDILCQNISSKFLTKVLQSNDHMTNQIIENESDLAFLMGHRNTLRQFYGRKTSNLRDKLSYVEETSRNHSLRQWNSRWQYPDFDTNLKHFVPRVENDPVLTNISTTKELMRHVIKVLLDINPSLRKFAYNRSLTASPLCSCKRTEEIAIHFLFSCKIWELRNLPTENFTLYDLTNCPKLVEFIRNCGRFE